MSYSEKDGQVVLTMSREDYEFLLMCLGIASGWVTEGEVLKRCLEFVNRLNEGNPNFTPYKVGEKKP